EGKYTVGIAAVDQAYASSAFATVDIDSGSALQIKTLDKVKVLAVDNAVLIMNNTENTLSCDILSLDGRVINSGLIHAKSSTSISMNNKGVYLVKLNDGENARIDKVIMN
ncbi:MAG TPA: T9SS type A sorting domain-containing protein, partial [Bacteroidales bacterium]|nr:T9SS type A sorting domain-containing protein [Bacteroidales bacterium]HUM89230.1 T9SS type A sorting domain-containing protein [Prolixibacteraceae bacterium]